MYDSEPVWTPHAKDLQNSQMSAFIRYVNEQDALDLEDYWDLYEWSIQRNLDFWQSLSQFLSISWHQQPIDVYTAGENKGLRGGTWFPQGTLNYAEHLLEGDSSDALITTVCEGRETQTWSRTDLRVAVAACADFLIKQGITKGDRVAGVVPNTIEAMIAMLATASVGAIWSSCSPDFGLRGILDRFTQIEPKVLFYTAGYQYNGKKVSCLDTLNELITCMDSLEAVAIIGSDRVPEAITLGRLTVPFSEILSKSIIPDLQYVPVSFSDPLYIMFSSGTTGVPKCIVHSVGGTLLQHLKELVLHCDVKKGKRLMYFTTCGWMMWNWMASALASGGELVLFEGSPSYPDISRLWQVVEKQQVNIFGTSPKFLAACDKAGLIPKEYLASHGLEKILSTGAPLLPEQFDWVAENVGRDIQLCSISGGTDIISCFMLGVPTLPVYRGEIQAPGLGMAIESWKDGKPVELEKGELVCTKPFPSMPVGFWNDPHQEKYHQAYFAFYPDHDVWHHGDFISITERRGIIVYGRSDATLNPGGIRIGTAEIYRVIEQLSPIQDSLAVARQVDGDSEIVLFIKAAEVDFDEELVQKIRTIVREQLTPRHLPKHIFRVSDIPYTRSGKKLELVVTKILADETVVNESSIANASCLNEYRHIVASYFTDR